MNGRSLVLPAVARAPVGQPVNADEAAAIDAARSFAYSVLETGAAAWERAGSIPRDVFNQAAAAGLTGLLVPRADAGQELSCAAFAAVLEALAGADLAAAFSLVVHNNLMNAIARHGTAEQRARLLPRLQKVELLGAFLLTEPGAGSDAAAITTRARRAADGWVLDGAKAWVTNGAQADLLSVYAQTDPDLGWRGIAAFLVDANAPGVIREPQYELLGAHALGTCGYRFEECRVPERDLLAAPGLGFRAALSGIDLARVCVAAMCTGMLARSLDLAVSYARQRKAFGAPVASFQGLQWQLADVATDLRAARLLTMDAARQLDLADEDAPASVAAAHAKKFATAVALDGIAKCMQAMGANGLKQEYPLARHLAGAKVAQYLDGTTEIQNVVISRALFGAPVAPADRSRPGR